MVRRIRRMDATRTRRCWEAGNLRGSRRLIDVRLALVYHPLYREHLASVAHAERPERVEAVLEGVADLHLGSDLVEVEARAAEVSEILRVHDPSVVRIVEELSSAGGGFIDADTGVGPQSGYAALVAAGAGLTAIESLRSGEADLAFCAVRPPGHHATPMRSMGFCLYNNVAITAAALVDAGERVMVIDIDAHHGNGTEAAFIAEPGVMYVSVHQWPLYPGTGRHDEIGVEGGLGTNVNIPMPAGSTGDAYLEAWDEIVEPAIERFAPGWLLISAGFDADRRDPLTELGLSAGDYADLGARIAAVAPSRKTMVVLEGGYNLEALQQGTTALLASMLGERVRPEHSTSGGPGRQQVRSLVQWWNSVGAELTGR